MYVVVLFRTFAFVLCQKNVTRFVTERSAVPHHILVHSIGPSMLYQQVKYKALVFTKTDHGQGFNRTIEIDKFPIGLLVFLRNHIDAVAQKKDTDLCQIEARTSTFLNGRFSGSRLLGF